MTRILIIKNINHILFCHFLSL